MHPDPVLLPRPRRFEWLGGALEAVPAAHILPSGDGTDVPGAARSAALAALAEAAGPGRSLPLRLGIENAASPHPEGYRLTIDASGVELIGREPAALYRGAMTLRQIARQVRSGGRLPCLRIEDAPAFPNRGVLLDVSRDKVPTMATLFHLVDRLAEWKFNQLQLYVEHTFAYTRHPEIWADASPFTPEEIRTLDAHCRARFVELVPNQNSFGHMERWLRHPSYAHLAELSPPPVGEPDTRPEFLSLCPVDPGSLELLEGLYEELLPNFSSGQVNVGCDETYDLGSGRSADACRERGAGRVYLDFLKAIHATIARHRRTMQFWGDIVLRHPELIPELPEDAIALDWGYEGDHPFADEASRFAAAGIGFYVCPGTSSWLSLLGRADNAIANLESAAREGLRYGARGYLVCDWGDHGHWQPLPVSYLGFAYGAEGAWSGGGGEQDLRDALDLHAFHDEARILGTLVHDMGNAYRETGAPIQNGTVLAWLLLRPEAPLGEGRFKDLSVDGLMRARSRIEGLASRLASASPEGASGAQVIDELGWAARLLSHACRLGVERLRVEGGRIAAIPSEPRARLASDLGGLIEDYSRLWLRRNRPGGLRESAGRMERLLAAYR